MSKLVKALIFAGAAAIVLATPAFAGGSVPVPEPNGFLMLVGGIGAIAGLRYYRRRK
jgi:peptidoglycan/LPS O-acetylase OafA/YrhL